MLISIHAPIVGCDVKVVRPEIYKGKFQSTHPSWGATAQVTGATSSYANFNPRTHRGVRPCYRYTIFKVFKYFNPRTHRGVRHCPENASEKSCDYFNPRTHRGVRLYRVFDVFLTSFISIHAPIVGCDVFTFSFESTLPNFNPRTHRGVRRLCGYAKKFDSMISIHAPIVGCDIWKNMCRCMSLNFNPRTHRGVRLYAISNSLSVMSYFNPRTHRGVRP